MRSRAARATLIAFFAGVVLLLLGAATDRRNLAFSLGVRASAPGVVLQPGSEACQRDVDVEVGFDSVQLLFATYFQPGPRLAIRVLDHASGRPITTAVLPEGYPDDKISTARLGRPIRAGRRIDVCLRDVGPRRVALFSGPATDTEPSYATLNGRRLDADILMNFIRREPRSVLSLVPDIFRRAALFHPRWVGAWTFWALAALLLVGVPALLSRAARAAADDEPPDR